MKWRQMVLPLLILTMLALGGCFVHPYAGLGSIYVTSEPAQGRVFLNGEDTGKVTPVVLEAIPSGVHRIQVEFPGTQEGFRTVVVQKDQQAVVHLTLGRSSLSGFVEHSRGGSAVEGATVIAYEAGTNVEVASTVTDAFGTYQFDLPSGSYDVVASKTNHAQARVQDITVNNDELTTANLVLRTLFNPTKAAIAPTISVTGLEPGAIVDHVIEVTIDVQANHPVDRIRAWVGNKDGAILLNNETDNDTTSFIINPALYSAGETELVIDTYDIQHNWAEMRIPFEIVRNADAVTPPQVVDVALTATTFGQDLGIFRLQRAELFEQGLLDGDPNQLELHDGTSLDLSSLKDDATLQIAITWRPAPNAAGYEIQRAWSADGPWVTIGKRSIYEITPDGYRFVDLDPALQPKLETFYRIRAIGPNGEQGEFSAPNSVTPLERFEVRLVSPADNSVSVPLNPTFQWEHNGVGSHQVFLGAVLGVTSPSSQYVVWEFFDEDITEVPFNYDGYALQSLKPATQYRWDIFHAYAYTLYGQRSAAQSFARQGRYDAESGKWINSGSINGQFTFVTAFEE